MVIQLPPPLAWAVSLGRIQVINRPSPTDYRGVVEIFGEPESGDYAEVCRLLNRAGVIPPIGVRSGFYGTVRLVNVIKFGSDAFRDGGLGDNPAATGPWCWVLEATPQDGEPRALAADEPCTGLLLKLAILAA